jgi:hypothetical protein
MRFIRERKFLLLLVVVLILAAVLAARQYAENQSRHAEMREAFIYLHSRGHNVEAEKLYSKLLWDLDREPTRHLVDDLQRTSVVAPTNESPVTNILVRFHRTVKRELEARFDREYLQERTAGDAKK